jgi:hypothetical protein
MENAVPGLLVGIGLSAACGFRVFVPMLGISIAALSGHITLASGFEWIGTWPALTAFATATVLEIAAYYIPVVDNMLDTVATPAAVVAGTIATAAMVGDMSPFLKWALAIIAGGGVAAVIQASTVTLRAAAQTSAPVVATPVVTTVETAGSILATVLAVLSPVLCLSFVVGMCCLMGLVIRRLGLTIRKIFNKIRPRKLSAPSL